MHYLITFLFVFSFSIFAKNIVHHNLEIVVNPYSGKVSISDDLGLKIKPNEIAVPERAENIEIKYGNQSIKFRSVKKNNANVLIPQYPKIEDKKLIIRYDFEPARPVGAISPGIDAVVSEQGVYLSPSSYWYPYVKTDFETLTIKAHLPKDWTSITSGVETSITNGASLKTQTWEISKPIDRVFFIANKFSVSEEKYKGILLQTFFHEDISSHSASYLAKLKEYIDVYLNYFGLYPYEKFAVISNFFSTGYGMPGFTLLDKNIIPYQFIVDTSLGHELLHNWWGNGVYVDWSKGNWCEGLTTYQADYLYETFKGPSEAQQYRLEALREYNNYVTKAKSFPVKDFRSRYDRVSKSIGYGKVMMIFYMLEEKLGTMTFDMGIQELVRTGLFNTFAWSDIEDAFERVSGQNLTQFFNQWVNYNDIIDLSYGLSGRQLSIEQKTNKPYEFNLEVLLERKDGSKQLEVFEVSQEKENFDLSSFGEIEDFQIDPNFKLMRVITQRENPPSLNKFWSKENNSYLTNMDKNFVSGFLSRYPDNISEIKPFKSLKDVKENSFIILNSKMLNNKSLGTLQETELNFTLTKSLLTLANVPYPLKENVIVLNLRYQNYEHVLVLAPDQTSMSKVLPKLSHYGKYGALVFDLNGRRKFTKSW